MPSYAAVPVAWRSCHHVVSTLGATTVQVPQLMRYSAPDCPLCGGSGFAPIRWTVQLLPDGHQAGSYATQGRADDVARILNGPL